VHILRTAFTQQCALTLPQYRVLDCLEKNDGRLRVHQVADALDLSPADISYVTIRLAAGGLIERRSDPTNKRVVIVALTPQGHARIIHAYRIAAQVAGSLMQPLGGFLRQNSQLGAFNAVHTYRNDNRQRDYQVDESLLNAFILCEQHILGIVRCEELSLSEYRILFELPRHYGVSAPTNLRRRCFCV
jgi:DNA-binding MarR family transcriptional regulator